MIKLLVLGGDGMLGHQLLLHFEKVQEVEVKVTLRGGFEVYEGYKIFNTNNSIYKIDAHDFPSLERAINTYKPDVILNAIGIVKQRLLSKEIVPSLTINSLLPHKLAAFCASINTRFITISTDCVFSGNKGNYNEEDKCDVSDLYGISKYYGEVNDDKTLTLRTSIIGLELTRKASLIEWFLAQSGSVNGFTKAIYSGFTTLEFCRIIEKLILTFPQAKGLYHVSMDPISKFDLLSVFANYLTKEIVLNKDEDFSCDRSLNSDQFRKDFTYIPPSWDDSLEELAKYLQSNNI